MTSEERRGKILQELKKSETPLSASRLAGEMGVSRQIIVGDVALLRASGADIIATPRGYVFGQNSPQTEGDAKEYRIACVHTNEQMEEELNLMVDFGCCVRDVIVEHPLYGQLEGQLNLRSRYDVAQFIRMARLKDAAPLSDLTGGVHLHTITCPDEECLVSLKNALREKGLLYE